MQTAAITKTEYKKILKNQELLQAQLNNLQKIVFEEVREYIKPSAIKRWEKISQGMDKGKGKRFSNSASLKSYLQKL
ncbi:hypothetical protein KKC83_00810 [Patescibacteria group bacterium]|nr:hypothetical protein [Candidatus Falkowbacteria bacterium]MBU3906123.1 hypothetical protein [Patescibacteria group bacterium]MCG2698510.1 hypothetical protein [Candidatus Parcubacteria bacterium]MBU4015523.1 hypothetical protein [Patescibacteria group bacterium]MBU4026071.1 hypothetical protein [Patescibacteria group bacterium]